MKRKLSRFKFGEMLGERGLYAAVLAQAKEDLCSDSGAPAALLARASALRWFADNSLYPFSFRDCCAVLELDPETVLWRARAPRSAEQVAA